MRKPSCFLGFDESLGAETVSFLKKAKPVGWSNVHIQPGSGPGSRVSSAIYASPTYGDVLFSGNSSGPLAFPADTWAFSFASASLWTKLASLPLPSGRKQAAMQYYPIGPGGVLYGGKDTLNTFADTWVLPDRFPVWNQPSCAATGATGPLSGHGFRRDLQASWPCHGVRFCQSSVADVRGL